MPTFCKNIPVVLWFFLTDFVKKDYGCLFFSNNLLLGRAWF